MFLSFIYFICQRAVDHIRFTLTQSAGRLPEITLISSTTIANTRRM